MKTAIVTGSAGLIGSASVRELAGAGYQVIGIDNDMRSYFFGSDSSTKWNASRLAETIPTYRHATIDIRNEREIRDLFKEHSRNTKIVVHTAAQPSHDWAAKEPQTDFGINATGTLNLLEATREFCRDATFIFTSTNKVYGDTPNALPLIEEETRWGVAESHPYSAVGIDESMSIDQSKHSLFGVSKAAADLLVQEYGRYFDMPTACFRGGCLTGPDHSGAPLHGFLAYLMRATVQGLKYTVYGYKGKQVRDNIHAQDLVGMFLRFHESPRAGEVYNAGGGVHANCSMLEAIALCEEISGKRLNWEYDEQNRAGDHIWWISDVRKFRSHYPSWEYRYDLRDTIQEIHDGITARGKSDE
jgi:CDP-paratose 2-epimerase